MNYLRNIRDRIKTETAGKNLMQILLGEDYWGVVAAVVGMMISYVVLN